MSKSHKYMKINFEEVFAIKIFLYETCLHEFKVYVKSFFFLLSGIERSRYDVSISMHFDSLV